MLSKDVGRLRPEYAVNVSQTSCLGNVAGRQRRGAPSHVTVQKQSHPAVVGSQHNPLHGLFHTHPHPLVLLQLTILDLQS